jgi:integrase
MGTKVFLRQKSISGKRKSLFLDYWPPIENLKKDKPGQKPTTRREFLGLYLFDEPKNETDEQQNAENLQLAEQIRNKRDIQLNGNKDLSEYEKRMLEKDAKERAKGEASFIEYFQKLVDKRKGSNHDNWVCAFNYLNNYTNGVLKFENLNQSFCNDFRDYLLTTKSNKSDKVTLSTNSALSYFNKFKAALKQAYTDEFLQTDLNAKIKPIKEDETHRNFLTEKELNQLVKTECNYPLLKRAALFSAMTGLRFSDIQKMVWSELEYIEGQGYFILFTQQKTGGVEVLPISEQAAKWLGERQEPNSKVFEGLTYSAYSNKHLAKWIGLAGIRKDITFHSFRHSYAVLQLSKGTEIYTVSKMLGHRDLKTTQIYAKIVDELKRKAADVIQLDINFNDNESK